METQALLQAEKLRNIILNLQQISDDVGVKQVDKLLGNIFENEIVLESFKRKGGWIMY